MIGTAHTLAEVEAAVAARLSEPVDGSGLLMAERAQQLAEALAQGKVEQLAHELGNVLVPLRLFAVRLAASALPTDPDGDVFTSAVRVLVAVERLSALHTASCRVADGQARRARVEAAGATSLFGLSDAERGRHCDLDGVERRAHERDQRQAETKRKLAALDALEEE